MSPRAFGAFAVGTFSASEEKHMRGEGEGETKKEHTLFSRSVFGEGWEG